MRRTLTLTGIVLLLALGCRHDNLAGVIGLCRSAVQGAVGPGRSDHTQLLGAARQREGWPPEQYKEATGGTRTVQYFDKGRMELTRRQGH